MTAGGRYGTCACVGRVKRKPLLFGLSLIAWIVWVGATASRLVDAQQPPAGTALVVTPGQAPAANAPAAQTPPAKTAPGQLPPGYAGTDACVLCHEPEAKSITHSRHGQAKDPRSPAGTLGCESCHGPGQAHVDDDAKGHIKKFKTLTPTEVNETCLGRTGSGRSG